MEIIKTEDRLNALTASYLHITNGEDRGARKKLVSVHNLRLRYGNTSNFARALGRGLAEAGIQSDCVNAKDASINVLKQYDLICVGAPTEQFSASKSIKEFLGKFESIDLFGKFGFALDAKAPLGIFGSAAEFIEKELKNRLGLKIVAPRKSATVFTGGSASKAR